MAIRKSITILPREKWKILKGHISGGAVRYKYAISNYGRIIKFNKNLSEGFLLNCSQQQGFPIWRKIMNGEYFAVLVHRLVAKYFLPKPTGKQKFVIHLDYNKENNYFKNLQWAAQQEVTEHSKKNPAVINAKADMRKNISKGGYNTKLTEAKVKYIKKSLAKGKTLKELAIKFKVSDMQIYRIKTGENWSHVK
jgi:HNH endonuclease/NUMOD4 motif